MKNILLILLIANLSSSVLLAQNQEWEVHIGTSNNNEYAEDLIEYYDKGYYIEGTIGGGSGWQIKTDVNGNVLWDEYLEHNEFLLQGWSVTMDNEGNRYIAGVKFNNTTWPFVAKFNYCGEKEWCKILTDDQLNSGGAMDIIINENDEIIILSNYMGIDNEAKIHLECLDKDGNYLWKQHYAKQEDYPWIDVPVAYDLMQHNNEYYISGYCYWPFPSDTTHFFLRPLFIGVDSMFEEKWILPFFALDSIFGDAYYSIPINDTLIMGVGIRKHFNNIDNSLIAIYNTDGEDIGYSEIFNEQIGPDIHSNQIREIARINDTLFLAAAMFGTDYSINPEGEFVLDTAGNLYHFQSRPNVSSASLIKSSDNNFVLASSIKEPNNDYNIILYKIDENLNTVPFDTNQYTYDSLCPEQIQSGTIDLSDCFIWTGTEEIPSPGKYYARIKTIPVTVYPNPATDRVHFKLENTEHNKNIMLKCFSLLGKEMYKTPIIPGQHEASTDVSGWQQGMFMVVVYSEGKVVGKAKMVVWR